MAHVEPSGLSAPGTQRLPGEEWGCQALDLAIYIGKAIRRKRPINAGLGTLGLRVLGESYGAGLLWRCHMLLPRLFQVGERL
jgi:hypothetical protein